ncbi:MAG: glycosyltransferase family 10 [Steroidobacteraceae bacterium]
MAGTKHERAGNHSAALTRSPPMPPLRLHFCDFGTARSGQLIIDFFKSLILPKYDVTLDGAAPDYVIYYMLGHEHLNHNCVRIYFTGENVCPDFNLCDYAIGSSPISFGDRYYRYPYYGILKDQHERLVRSRTFTAEDLRKKTNFCNFIYSNSFLPTDPTRDAFFHLLSRYKRVDSVGQHLNNLREAIGDPYQGAWYETKVEYQRKYKFTIAFDNSSVPGYTTEKITHAFLANTIPIYWGNPDVSLDFNPRAFINVFDFPNLDAVVDRVREIDANDDLYLQILNEPPYKNNELPAALQRDNIGHFLDNIFRRPKELARRRPKYGYGPLYEGDIREMAMAKRYQKYNLLGRALRMSTRLTARQH